MARRIALPGTDELFSDATPYAASRARGDDARPAGTRPRRAKAPGAAANADGGQGKAASPRARRRSGPAQADPTATAGPGRGKPAGAPPAASPGRRPRAATTPARSGRPAPRGASSGVAARIDAVEARLRDLPIDTLLSLRDDLEALLIEGPVAEADVERVLTGR